MDRNMTGPAVLRTDAAQDDMGPRAKPAGAHDGGSPTRANAPSVAAPETSREAQPKPLPKQQPTFVYRPIWDVRRSAILSYWCVPNRRPSDGRAGTDAGVADGDMSADDVAELDQHALATALSALAYLRRENRRLLVGCQVHFETMARPDTRRSFIELCRRTPDDMRSYLILESVGAPIDVYSSRAAAIVSALRPFCRAVHWTIPPGQTHCEGFGDLGMAALGVDIRGWQGGERELIGRLNGLATAIRRLHMKPFVHGIGSVSLATSAVCAGFEYVSGDAVHKTLSGLENAYRFEARDLFAYLLKNG